MSKAIIDNSDYPEPRIELEESVRKRKAPSIACFKRALKWLDSCHVGLECESYEQLQEMVDVLHEAVDGRMLRYTATSDFKKNEYYLYVMWRPY